MRFDVYQAVTDRILKMLDKGTVPWRHPIRNAGGGRPKNIKSDRPYRGVNVFLLRVTSWLEGNYLPLGRSPISSASIN
jgi:antirestriction protein ArdC